MGAKRGRRNADIGDVNLLLSTRMATSCRSCGSGGTTIEFKATPEGVQCSWYNESLDDDNDNKSMISWMTMEQLMAARPRRT